VQPALVRIQAIPPPSVVCQRMVRLATDGSAARCLFADQSSLTLSRFVAGFIRPPNHIEFDPTAPDPSREFRVLQDGPHKPRELYVAPIGYVAQPKTDKRGDYFLRAAIPASRLGLKQLYLRNEAVRDHFYFPNRRRSGCEEATFYDLLRAAPSSSPTDLRLALKIRMLELQTAGAWRDQLRAIERAFNILANPELRSCYDALLVDPDAPAIFPYGGFGSIIVSGELSPDRDTFFAKKILSFLPETRERRFRAPLRSVAFLEGSGVYRDSKPRFSWTKFSCPFPGTRPGINGSIWSAQSLGSTLRLLKAASTALKMANGVSLPGRLLFLAGSGLACPLMCKTR
jgi:hypothetical protein